MNPIKLLDWLSLSRHQCSDYCPRLGVGGHIERKEVLKDDGKKRKMKTFSGSSFLAHKRIVMSITSFSLSHASVCFCIMEDSLYNLEPSWKQYQKIVLLSSRLSKI